MQKTFIIALTLFLLSTAVFSETNEREPLIQEDTRTEPWSMKIGISGVIIDFSNWGSYLGIRYHHNKNVYIGGLEFTIDDSSNEDSSNDYRNFSIGASIDYNRILKPWKVSPYLGSSLAYTYKQNITENSTEQLNRITLSGIFGAELHFAEHFSIYFEYLVSGSYKHESDPDSDNNTYTDLWEFDATKLKIGLLVYFGD